MLQLPEHLIHGGQASQRRHLGNGALRQRLLQILTGVGFGDTRHRFGRSLRDNTAARFPAPGTKIDDPICSLYQINIMLNDQNAAAIQNQSLKRAQQFGNIVEVQPRGGFIQEKQGAFTRGRGQMCR